MPYNLVEMLNNNKFIIYNGLIVIVIIIVLSKNITFLKLVLVFFLFLVSQIVSIYANSISKSNIILYKNFNEIENQMNEALKYRVELLNTNKMKYDSWLKYNK